MGPVQGLGASFGPLRGPFGSPGGPYRARWAFGPGSGHSGAAGLACASMPVERSGGTDRTKLDECIMYLRC